MNTMTCFYTVLLTIFDSSVYNDTVKFQLFLVPFGILSVEWMVAINLSAVQYIPIV